MARAAVVVDMAAVDTVTDTQAGGLSSQEALNRPWMLEASITLELAY
jgi:hypothetical protein